MNNNEIVLNDIEVDLCGPTQYDATTPAGRLIHALRTMPRPTLLPILNDFLLGLHSKTPLQDGDKVEFFTNPRSACEVEITSQITRGDATGERCFFCSVNARKQSLAHLN